MESAPHEGLELDEDLQLERRTHTLKQVLRWALLGLALAGLLGLLGGGLLSGHTAATADGHLRVHYERITRQTVESTLRIEVSPGAGELALRLPRAYLEAVDLEDVRPSPLHQTTSGDEVRLVFARGSIPTTAHVELAIKPHGPGVLSGSVGIVGGPEIPFDQFVLP